MADALIVGRTIGIHALAAVGSVGSMNFLVLGFMIGFTQGLSIITAQRFGAGDMDGVRKSFAAGIALGSIATVALMAASVVSARPLLRLLNTPPDIIDAAYSYIVVIYWGFPAALLFNLLSGMMRAVGDSVTPLIFLVIASVINILLDFAFILWFKTGVEGAAYATVIAQAISGVLCIPVMVKKFPMLRARKEDWKRVGARIWEHGRVAFPMGFQMSIIAIGAVTVTFALNNLGSTIAVAAYTASQKIDMMATMPLSSFGVAMTTYVAQNYGARKIDRIKKGILYCYAISGTFSVVMGLVCFFAGQRFASLFLGPDQAEAMALSHTYLKITGSFYFSLAWLFIARQSLQGLGNSIVPTLAGIMELLMRVFAAILLPGFFGFAGLCLANPLAWLGACLPLTIATVLTIRRLDRRKSLA
jgi:putative MATE family efflux protein